jgi:hypothetical protein
MIKTLTLHNNDTTPKHNEVGLTHGLHSIMSLLYSVSVRITLHKNFIFSLCLKDMLFVQLLHNDCTTILMCHF